MAENPFVKKEKRFGIGVVILSFIFSIISTSLIMNFSSDIKQIIMKQTVNKFYIFMLQGLIGVILITGLATLFSFLLLFGIKSLINRDNR